MYKYIGTELTHWHTCVGNTVLQVTFGNQATAELIEAEWRIYASVK